MISLKSILSAWGSPAFNDAFKGEVERLRHDELPLQQGLTLSSSVSAEPFRVMVISSEEEAGKIRVKAGIFYSGIIAGCSCSDDPTPTDVQQEYCDVMFTIDRVSGEASATLISD
jgi:hypothetical protein